jgi:hypothetical protein
MKSSLFFSVVADIIRLFRLAHQILCTLASAQRSSRYFVTAFVQFQKFENASGTLAKSTSCSLKWHGMPDIRNSP